MFTRSNSSCLIFPPKTTAFSPCVELSRRLVDVMLREDMLPMRKTLWNICFFVSIAFLLL
jgi:hypothetical protein